MRRVAAKQVTIKEIAKVAGVSVTTVSDSLSGKGRLPDQTRERIRRLAAELGYRPSHAARSLVHGRTGIIVMSVAAPHTPVSSMWSIDFFVDIMTAAANVASTREYALTLAPRGMPVVLAYDGALVVDPTADDEIVAHAYADSRPVVTVGRSPRYPTSWVDNDYPVMVPTVLDHFAAMGATRPALLASATDASYVDDMVTQYHRWCKAHRRKPLVRQVTGGLTAESGREAARSLLSAPSAPDAIFATLDHLAQGAVDAVRERGGRVPEDVLVASLGDSTAIANAAVPITALDLSPAELGSKAITMLIDQIENPGEPRTEVVAGTLVARASTQHS